MHFPERTHTRHKPQNVNHQQQVRLSLQDRLALLITSAVGTMYAVYFFAAALAGWMLWQGAIAHHPFDPYPFAFLLFMGNIVQLLLMPLIMVGQNIQGRHSELRSDEEYKTTLTSYHDVELILKHLEAQDVMMERQQAEILRQSKMIEDLLRGKERA